MKATKFLSLVALVLTFAACSYEDNPLPSQQTADTPQPSQQTDDNMITITAKLAPMDDVAQTRAVREDKKIIVVEWAVDEHLAILYTKDKQKYLADAKITNVDATTGEATIEFSVESGTADSTACTIVYPISAAKDDHSGVKSYADLMSRQDGKLDADLDVRVGEGTILTSTPGLTVTKQPAAQYGIVKFTVQDLNKVVKNVTYFKLSDDAGNVITTVTPDSATSVLYIALPSLPSNGMTITYWFNATAEGKPYIAKAAIFRGIDAGKYYQVEVDMATIGDVILSNRKFAPASSTETKTAMIAYLGNGSDCRNGLAIQLECDFKYRKWNDAMKYAEEVWRVLKVNWNDLGGTWRLPSKKDWENMLMACAKDGDSPLRSIDGFKEKITATGIPWKSHERYWTSTRFYDRGRDAVSAYFVTIDFDKEPARAHIAPRPIEIEGERTEPEFFALACYAF